MHRLLALIALLAAVACTAESTEPSTSSSGPSILATTSTAVVTTTTMAVTTEPPPDCGAIPYAIDVFPARVETGAVPTDDVERDPFTSVPGTVQQIWVDGDGTIAMAFIRGALPPIDWPGERGEVSIDGARGIAGPHTDGSWVVAWFEGSGEPCDRFYLIFYPPVEPAEVEATVASLDRRAG